MRNRTFALGFALILLTACSQPSPVTPTHTPFPTYTPYPTQVPQPTLTPYSTNTRYPTSTFYPTYTPHPTHTPLPSPTPTSTPVVLPTLLPLGPDQAKAIQLYGVFLWIFMVAVPVLLGAHELLDVVGRKQVRSTLKTMVNIESPDSAVIGFCIVLGVFSLVALIITQYPIQNAFGVFLLLWLLASEDLYPGVFGTGGLVARARPFIVLLLIYALSWIGFMAVGNTGSVVGTLFLYMVGLILYKGATDERLIRNPVLRAKMADDMFLMIVTFILFMSALYGSRQSTSATLVGTAVDNLFWDVYGWRIPILNSRLIPLSKDVAYSVFKALTDAAVLEYYAYSIWLLFQILKRGDAPAAKSPTYRMPNGLLWFTVNVLGAVVIATAVTRMFAAPFSFQGPAVVINTAANLIIAMLGALVLTLARRRRTSPSTDVANSKSELVQDNCFAHYDLRQKGVEIN